RGKPNGIGDFNQHDFISASEPQHLGTPFLRWLSQNVPAEHIRLRCNEMPDMERAVTSGFGIGFVPHKLVGDRTDLVEVLPSRRHWTIKSWRVTHLDLHRSEKVQALLQILKQAR
ncbi:MAG: LysR substrate-binding domain-containing protein, partial [Pseudomonadota bacterium]